MRNSSRLPLIAGLVASLVSLGLLVQLAQLGMLLLLGTGVARARPSLDPDPARLLPAAGAERIASASAPGLPRPAAGSGASAQAHAGRVHVDLRAAARADARLVLPPADDGAGTESKLPQSTQHADGPSASRLFLLDVREPAAGPSVTVTGFDLAAPRDLVLWQVDEALRRAAPLATTSSRADGLFELSRLLLPTQGVRLVVTPEGGDPFDGATAAALEMARLAPPPPRAWVDVPPAGAAGATTELRVSPDSDAYELSLGDATEREIARLSIPAATGSRLASAPLRFEIDELPLWVARERSDGSRSAWSEVPTRQLAGNQPGMEEAP